MERNVIIYWLLYIWQLPQNLVGLIYKYTTRGEKLVLEQRNCEFYIAPTINGGISLGNYIFISPTCLEKEAVYDHEYGHSIQSKILGPLYLPIIGVFSGLHCLLYNGTCNYYHFWTERWANILAKIPEYTGQYHHHEEGLIHTNISKIAQLWRTSH